MRLSLRAKKAAGGDENVANKTFTLGVDAPGLTATTLTLVGGNDDLLAGDVLYMEKDETGAGMASPELTIQVEYGGY
jgi:hypothetical protein